MEELPERVTLLIESLGHSDKKVIRQAAEALISIAPQIPSLAQRLEELLEASAGKSRWPIAYVLAHISQPSSLCLEALRETLGSKDPDIRWAMGLLFVRLGKTNEAIAGFLYGLLTAGTPTQRRMALYCLRDLDPHGPTTLKALIQSLADPDPSVRIAAITSLAGQAKVAPGDIQTLLRLFREDPDSRVRCSAAFTLAQLGGPTPQILAALKAGSRSEDPQIKKAANAALGLLQTKGPAPQTR